jgi:hypothetical protein
MANIKKSFNFRNGFQVDDDNVVVNANGLVGIGTSIPVEALDVRGNVKVTGICTLTQVFTNYAEVVGFATLTTGSIGLASFTSDGIVTATRSSGIITYYGDGGRLLNLPTSQWLDVDTGIGFTSIYAQGNVGVATFLPLFKFQVGGIGESVQEFDNGLGITESGDVYTAGVITSTAANGGFFGSGAFLSDLNASNVSSGTLSNSRLPIIANDRFPSNINISGVVTASTFSSGNFIGTFTGGFVGIASTARDLTSDANVSITQVTAGFATCGLTTIAKLDVLNSNTNRGTIGINTTTHRSDFHISKVSGISSILVTSSSDQASLISLGRNFSNRTGGLRFGKSSTLDVFDFERSSNANSLDVINYDISNLNHYISGSDAKFHWIYRAGNTLANPIMTLTSNGKLIVGSGTTVAGEETLRVVGILTVTNNNDAFFDRNVSIKGDLNVLGNFDIGIDGKNLNVDTGISTIANIDLTTQLAIAGPDPFEFLDGYSLTMGDWKFGSSGSIVMSENIGVGIGTTSVRNVQIGGIGTDFRLDAYEAYSVFKSISIGTTNPSAFVDFSAAGQVPGGSARRYMIVPKATTTNINSFTSVSGGVVYDTTVNSFKGYNGSSWQTFATGTTNRYPENNTGDGDYTLQSSDLGKLIKISRSGGSTTLTIPNTLGATIGDTIVIHNTTTSGQTDVTIAHATTANLLFAGGQTGNRTLSQYGVATLICVASNTFAIYGNGIT